MAATSETTPVIPKGLLDIYGLQTGLVNEAFPAFRGLTLSTLQGQDLATNPYIRGLYGILGRGQNRAEEMIRNKVPRGPGQDYAVGQTARDFGMQRAQLESEQQQRILQSLLALFGAYTPQSQIGQQTSSSPGSSLGVSIGPLSYSTSI